MSLLWGIDLGGTKIEGVVVASKDPSTPLCRLRIPTEADKGYDHIVARIGLLLNQMSEVVKESPRCVGFGTPGTIDPPTGLMKNCNAQALNGMPLKADLERKFKIEARISNDANCFALAEAKLGAGKGAPVVFGVIMGTGVGGGVVVNGEVLAGCQGIGGEWGHNQLLVDAPLCYCGKKGCVESVCCGPALEAFYKSISGESLKLPEIEKRAADGSDSNAAQTIERLIDSFGRAISVVINILDPHVVVLGGGVSNIAVLYSDRTRAAISRHVFNNRLETKILKNQMGDSAGVFGAVMLGDSN